jgi:hypothetical protein
MADAFVVGVDRVKLQRLLAKAGSERTYEQGSSAMTSRQRP